MTDWKSIHKGFGKEWHSGKNYQQAWEEAGFTYQEAQTWIQARFKPNEYHRVKQWKDYNFSPWEVKSWIDKGLNKNDYKFATYLRSRGYQQNQPNLYLN